MEALLGQQKRAFIEALFIARADEYVKSRFASQVLYEDLSIREHTILKMLAKGLTADEVTSLIGCSLNTTRSHIRSIHAKLDVNSTVQAIFVGKRLGLDIE
jgi:DNA-binding CsgD family transcriptional regulator